ncbi:hypothetical protein [Fulvivirga sedimenti]|nr:hypothetical protein [Fulvivirga sedimenti]
MFALQFKVGLDGKSPPPPRLRRVKGEVAPTFAEASVDEAVG